MKKLLFILAVLFFSCEKADDTFCWQCKTTTVYKATHYATQTETSVEVKCDLTEEGIREFEKDESSVVVIKIGLTTASTEKSCNCIKMQ
jgi:hypothetical protein